MYVIVINVLRYSSTLYIFNFKYSVTPKVSDLGFSGGYQKIEVLNFGFIILFIICLVHR